MKLDNTQQAFLSLVKAGLWENETLLMPYGNIDFEGVLQLAEEQSVVGLVTAGFEKLVNKKSPQELLLQFVGEALQLEQQNLAMNKFIAQLITFLRKNDVLVLIVKGQGIAQYKRPWVHHNIGQVHIA